MQEIIIDSNQKKKYCQSRLSQIPEDGTETVVFKKTDKSSTARQRRLQWKWNTEVAQSGLGQDDDKNSAHVRAKWWWARPIWLRDSDTFNLLYNAFQTAIKDILDVETKQKMYLEFARDYISTERMTTKQRAEYLTEFQRFWCFEQGVCLTDPAMRGVDLSKF